MPGRWSPIEASQRLNALSEQVLASPWAYRTIVCYNVTVQPDWAIVDRRIEHFHMVFVKDGTGTYVIEGEREELKRGKIIFLSPGVHHASWKPLERKLSIVSFRFNIYDYSKDQYVPPWPGHSYFTYTPANYQLFLRLFEAVYSAFRSKPSLHRDVMTHTALAGLIAEIGQALQDSEASARLHPGIAKLMQYINNFPARRHHLKEYANIAGFSPKYCSRLFLQTTGLTLKEYQIRSRLEYAKFLLEQSSQSVKEVAITLGYADPYIFSKQFKAYMGYPPSKPPE